MGARLKLIASMDPATPDLAPPPPLRLEPCSPAELRALVHAGENDSDACERVLARSARVAAALDLALGEGLLALLSGDRLLALGFSSPRDYAREVLDLGERHAQALVQLARELRTRPLLAAAVRAGEVRIRHAQTVLPVAIGAAEAGWVARAKVETVRALEVAVREARAGGLPEDEWLRLRVHLSPEDRATVDEALAAAGEQMAGSTRAERLEALAQEYLGGHPEHADDDVRARAIDSFRRTGEPARREREERLERETDRWSYLDPVPGVPAPVLRLGPYDTELELDARLRELAALRRGWDEVVGLCAHVVKRSGLWRVAGFASFEQYCRERLGLSLRAVEQRAALEKRLWERPALRAARDAGLSYERLRLLARLPDRELAEWIPRARTLTVFELRVALAERDEAQLRAARVLGALVPERVASVLQAAFRAVRKAEGCVLGDGRCLALIARHFLASWPAPARKAKTRSQQVRVRDGSRCQVPGCSQRAVHSHHVIPRWKGGSDHPSNLVALCALHHLRGVHGGYLRVRGRAPDALGWEIGPVHAPVDLRACCLAGLGQGGARAAA